MNALYPMTPTYHLSLWQKRQAAMLYHYSSQSYLDALLPKIEELIVMAEMLLERRSILDPLMVSERWGVRDTAANWSTGGFPALIAYRQSTMWHMAKRADQCYGITGTNQCAHMLGEFSMQWATAEQEKAFRKRAEQVFRYGYDIDGVMQRSWNDAVFWFAWQEVKEHFPQLPKFKVHLDIEGETGKVPVRTGVYIPQDDPNGALQFGWIGGGEGFFKPLEECQTFNEIGLEALSSVGRAKLWVDASAMLNFVRQPRHANVFPYSEDPAYYQLGNKIFTERPCKWYFVELLEGEFEDSDPDAMADAPGSEPQHPPRKASGEPCPHAGWWFSPAREGSRQYFRDGAIFPKLEGDYGYTFWLWSPDQSRPTLC
ncbi:hypothetical protein [Pseudomonas sp. Irchel 3E20]|uniref:hypothetical protein n=1 Tax=Pseudomonas sp. Irchel 3E20 TaxID=2008983 RepID=UPI00113FD5D2|nr:hypothetical protein [Pseudomonas sp. Irchel 3E20]